MVYLTVLSISVISPSLSVLSFVVSSSMLMSDQISLSTNWNYLFCLSLSSLSILHLSNLSLSLASVSRSLARGLVSMYLTVRLLALVVPLLLLSSSNDIFNDLQLLLLLLTSKLFLKDLYWLYTACLLLGELFIIDYFHDFGFTLSQLIIGGNNRY